MERMSQALVQPQVTLSAESQRPLRLLSLDGGGVRGLSEIIILKHLMRNISRKEGRVLEPWEAFDMIGGTSTGGLIAIMLGRLKMSLRQCEAAYLRVSERIFASRHHKFNVPSRSLDFLLANGRFDGELLAAVIKEVIREDTTADESALLQDPDTRCRVFVSATRVNNSQLALLRSYESTMQETLFDDCMIWEACRATSAAPMFFDSVKIGPYNQQFVDGGLLYSNPIQLLHREGTSIWPDRINGATFISIGTGSAPGKAFDGHLKSIVEAMKEIVVNTEIASNDFYLAHPEIVQRHGFFRFNVFHGLADVGLEEWREKSKIADFTETYLELPEIASKTQLCVRQLCLQNASEIARLPSQELFNELYQSLYFKEMHKRQDGLTEASTHTFDWMFGDKRTGISEWLTNGNAIFWITGKAGSGKSTLLKYLIDHESTKEIMQVQTPACIPISFFFDRSGSRLERSCEGLLRAILLEMVLQVPQLASTIMPEATASRLKAKILEWSRKALEDALLAVLQQKRVSARFCLFTDALDEYEGGDWEIAQSLQSWTTSSIQKAVQLKACVSSRPHTAFQEAFRGYPTLHIAAWTSPDIRQYINGRLQQHSRAQGEISEDESIALREIGDDIADRADGVFLWVRLMTDDLFQSLCDGSTITTIQEQLAHAPPTLERMYVSMIERVDPRYHSDTEFLIEILLLSTHPLTLFEFAEAAMDTSECFERPIGAVKNEARDAASKLMLLRLQSRCGGLVEVTASRSEKRFSSELRSLPRRPGPPITARPLIFGSILGEDVSQSVANTKPALKITSPREAQVRFIHKSVEDFLSKPGTWEQIFGHKHSESTSLEAREALMAGAIRRLKASISQNSPTDDDRRQTCWTCREYVVQQADSEISPGMHRLLDEMDFTYTHEFEDRFQAGKAGDPDHPTSRNWAEEFAARLPCPHWQDNWLSLAIELGMTSYVTAKVRANPLLVRSKQGRPLLHYAADSQHSSYDSAKPSWRDTLLIECLLAFHSDPNKMFDGLSAFQTLLYDTRGAGLVPKGDPAYENGLNRTVNALQWNWWHAVSLMLDYGGNFSIQMQDKPPLFPNMHHEETALIRGLDFDEDVFKAMEERLGENAWQLMAKLNPWIDSHKLAETSVRPQPFPNLLLGATDALLPEPWEIEKRTAKPSRLIFEPYGDVDRCKRLVRCFLWNTPKNQTQEPPTEAIAQRIELPPFVYPECPYDEADNES